MDKKTLKIIILFLIIFLIMPTTVQAEGGEAIVISAGNVYAKSGGEVTVNINLVKNPGLLCAKIAVEYDSSALTVVNVSNGSALSDDIASVTYSPTLDYAPYTIIWMCNTANDVENIGLLASITFSVKETTPLGDYEIRLLANENDFANDLYENVPVEVTNGVVSVIDNSAPLPSPTPSLQKGDANSDGVINTADTVFILRYVIAGGELSPNQEYSCDGNSDGIINTGDAVWILQLLIS